MSGWYARQFGDRGHFALSFTLGHHPHQSASASPDSIWGGFALWARGRCLTRSVCDEGGVADEIRWDLLPILEWFIEVGVRLVNEEPFPALVASDRVRDATDWFNESEDPPVTLTVSEEDAWFQRRSDWRRHHALRTAALDVSLPNVHLRRLGSFLELSWDNETWGTPRPSLSFIEKRGTELVSVREAAKVIEEAIGEVTGVLHRDGASSTATALSARLEDWRACEADWRWLVHEQAATVLDRSLPQLAERLGTHARANSDGLLVPHTPETLALRQARLGTAAEIMSLLNMLDDMPDAPVSDELATLRNPSLAPPIRPWQAGYESAQDLRDSLGWGVEPLPDLGGWLAGKNVAIKSLPLPGWVHLLTAWRSGRALANVNPQGSSLARREAGLATALGHLLMDESSVSIDGAWEHWPTAARARAFGVMLLLPDEGVKSMLSGRGAIDSDGLQRLMDHFGTGPHATTYHLRNRGFIDEDRRARLVGELGG